MSDDDKPGIYFICQQPNSGVRTSIKVDVDSGCSDVVDAFRSFLLAMGYAPQVVDQNIGPEEA